MSYSWPNLQIELKEGKIQHNPHIVRHLLCWLFVFLHFLVNFFRDLCFPNGTFGGNHTNYKWKELDVEASSLNLSKNQSAFCLCVPKRFRETALPMPISSRRKTTIIFNCITWTNNNCNLSNFQLELIYSAFVYITWFDSEPWFQSKSNHWNLH